MKIKQHEKIIEEIVPLRERRDYGKQSIIKQNTEKKLTQEKTTETLKHH